ncbi:Uncharacterized protein Tcan_12599 [Toxocara canis]|uniref:DUF7627 domain-containing protein n=1 Tax=Toxocara canis TaxID=6265 RepID=A0A0B2V0Q8_TOXCA|nr:Uncharacterized protein Tcan_12599 [Toxocara canis]
MPDEGGTGSTPSTSCTKRESRQATPRHFHDSLERDRRLLNSIQSTLSAGRPLQRRHKNAAEPPDSASLPSNAEDIIAKMSAMTIDNQSSAYDLRRLLSAHEVQELGDETWSRVGALLADSAFREGDAHFAVDMAVLVIDRKAFQSSFAERISSEMSSYILCPEIAKTSLPQVVALLLVASWPRAHSRSNLESNEVLYTIISAIKGWIITVTDEVEEDAELMSRCAIALGEICRFAQRRLWMKWPELVDEIYVAIQDRSKSSLAGCIRKDALMDYAHFQIYS